MFSNILPSWTILWSWLLTMVMLSWLLTTFRVKPVIWNTLRPMVFAFVGAGDQGCFGGAADHGYSEALYLEDLEGNGIELYRDKPVAEWDIREDGRIVGVTEELSAQEIYEMGRKVEPFLIAKDTRMGHIHLSVKDSQLSSAFYQEVLELADKFTIPSASWIASGDYHHHLAVNEWGGKNLAKREEDMPGLAYYVLEVEDKEDLIAIAERANNRGAEVKWLSSNTLTFEDNDGILTRVRKNINN